MGKKKTRLRKRVSSPLVTKARFRSRKLNVSIRLKNQSKGPLEAKLVPVEVKYAHGLKPIVYNANKPGQCSGYVTRAAELFFGKKFVKANAWDLPSKNIVILKASVDLSQKSRGIDKARLALMIKKGVISPGTILGIFYSLSTNNRPKRPFTHVIIYAGQGVFWHNHLGVKSITLNELYSKSKRFFPVMIIEPGKQK